MSMIAPNHYETHNRVAKAAQIVRVLNTHRIIAAGVNYPSEATLAGMGA